MQLVRKVFKVLWVQQDQLVDHQALSDRLDHRARPESPALLDQQVQLVQQVPLEQWVPQGPSEQLAQLVLRDR